QHDRDARAVILSRIPPAVIVSGDDNPFVRHFAPGYGADHILRPPVPAIDPIFQRDFDRPAMKLLLELRRRIFGDGRHGDLLVIPHAVLAYSIGAALRIVVQQHRGRASMRSFEDLIHRPGLSSPDQYDFSLDVASAIVIRRVALAGIDEGCANSMPGVLV